MPSQVSATIAVLTDGLVDYAGLFPPAALDMPAAVKAYAEYLRDPHCGVLARFVVPVTRLAEFAAAAEAARLFDRPAGAPPIPLAVLASADAEQDVAQIDEFNTWYSGRAVADVVEAKAMTPEQVTSLASVYHQVELYVEVPVAADPEPFIAAIARAGVRAKIRTGGVTPNAFPAPEQVVRFIMSCLAHGVTFKATAGLHHPMSGEYRLTYAPDSPMGTMYGFLNVFLAAAFLNAGVSADEAAQILTERSAEAFRFDDAGVTWRSHTLTLDQLRHTRRHVARSFGSCSFREPVDELSALQLLDGTVNGRNAAPATATASRA